MKYFHRIRIICLVAVCIACSMHSGLAEILTPGQIAREYEAMSGNGIDISAEYQDDVDYFTLVVQATNIDPTIWAYCDKDVQMEYHSLLSNISANLKKSLDLIGFGNTCVVCTFQLSDGGAIYLSINNIDFSSML